MSEERFDRIDAGLNRLTILHEETRTQVKLIAEGLVGTNERIDSMDHRLDSMDHRLDSMDQHLLRMETLLTRHDTRITALEKRPPARR